MNGQPETPAVAPAVVPGVHILVDPRTLERSSNPRRKPVSAARISEIAESMRKHHVLEPLIVRPTKKPDVYQVVAGDTRQKAAIEAELPQVPCIIRELDDLDMLELQLIENVQRNDMHPVDEGEAFKRLIAGRKYTAETLAKTIGKSVRWVYNRLEFTKLIPSVRQAFLDEEITATHAELLARLEPADQERAFKEGLFHQLWSDGAKDEKRHVVSVKDLTAWIQDHVRLNVRTDAVQHLIPEIEEVVDEADAAARADGTKDARILQVSHDYMAPQDPKLRKQLEGVLFSDRNWKPAESTKQRCEFMERAVIVFGHDQGKVLQVCANKKCAKHFPEHTSEAKEKRAKQRARQTSGGDTRDDYAAKMKREREEQERLRVRWAKLGPAIRVATFKTLSAMTTITPAMLAAALKQHRLPTVKAVQVNAMLVHEAVKAADRNTWYGNEPKVVAWAKLLGVDVKAIERATFPPAIPEKDVKAAAALKAKSAKRKAATKNSVRVTDPKDRKAIARVKAATRARKAGKKR